MRSPSGFVSFCETKYHAPPCSFADMLLELLQKLLCHKDSSLLQLASALSCQLRTLNNWPPNSPSLLNRISLKCSGANHYCPLQCYPHGRFFSMSWSYPQVLPWGQLRGVGSAWIDSIVGLTSTERQFVTSSLHRSHDAISAKPLREKRVWIKPRLFFLNAYRNTALRFGIEPNNSALCRQALTVKLLSTKHWARIYTLQSGQALHLTSFFQVHSWNSYAFAHD